MPLALGNGYTDTGITLSVTVSGEARVRMATDGNGGAYGNDLDINGTNNVANFGLSGEWKLAGNQFTAMDLGTCDPSTPYIRSSQAWFQGPGMVSAVELEDVYDGCIASIAASAGRWSQWYAYTETVGPYRLGVKYELIGSSQAPNFAKDYKLVYAWFADENTQRTGSFAGTDAPDRYYQEGGTWAETPDSGFTPEENPLWRLVWGGESPDVGLTAVQFRNLTVGGSGVDTSDLDDGWFDQNDGVRDTQSGSSVSAGPPYTLTYDIDVLNMAGSSTGIQIDTLCVGERASGYTGTHTFRNVSWTSTGGLPSSYEALSVDATDAAAETPAAWDNTDLTLRIWGAPARSNPNAAASYTPVTVTLEDVLDVHRPDGNTPSSFVASSGDIAVTENAGDSVFVVDAPGSYVRREFGETGTDLPAWRKWLGVGVSGKSDAAFNPDKTHITKHASGEDIWDWASYGYLRLTIDAPTADDLTLTLEGVQLSVSDSHVTGSQRTTDFTVTETPYTKTYTVPVSAGANTVLVDLLFPNEGGPYYHGRIDAVKLSGFAVGTYTLSGLDLVSCTDPSTVGADEVYLKCLFRSYGQRSGDYDALHAAHNGAACLAATTDRTQCSELFGNDGRGLRYITVSTGSGTGFILDSQLALENFWLLLNEVEGWTVAYSAAAFESANEDPYGSALAPELAEWTDDLPGNTLTAGSASGITARPKCGRLYPVPGHTFLIRTRDCKGSGAIEVLAKTDQDTRAPAASPVEVQRTDTSAVYATGNTDAHGFVIVSPLPANGSFQWTVGGTDYTLKQRDRLRATFTIAVEGFWPWSYRSRLGWYYRAFVEAGDVCIRRSRWRQPPFDLTTQVTSTGDTARPTLAEDHRERLHLLWHYDAGGGSFTVYLSTSDDDGATWSTPVALFSGGKYPLLRQDPISGALVAMAYVSGEIKMRRKYIGDTSWSTAASITSGGVALAVEDEAFGLEWMGDPQSRLLLAVKLSGETAIREYRSFDDGSTFEEIV